MKKIVFLIQFSLVSFTFCGERQSNVTSQNKFKWEVVHPSEVKLDENRLLGLIKKIEDSVIHSVDGIVVVKNSKIALEQYFNGFSKDSLHNVASVGKSITSALVGIAIDKGLIPGLQTKIAGYFEKDYDIKDSIGQKQQIEIQHLLTMSAGWDCDDWDESSLGNSLHFPDVADDFAFILNLPAIHAPGDRFAYCSGGANLLGEIIRRTSGQNLQQFADDHLFNKLGITKNQWFIVPKPPGYEFSGGGNSLTPRDMAKLGLLYLNHGHWDGDQIIPKEWVQASTTTQIETPEGDRYGYFWWIREFNFKDGTVMAFEASGNGGNKITVIPELEMVIVLTGSGYGSEYVEGSQARIIMEEFLLASVI